MQAMLAMLLIPLGNGFRTCRTTSVLCLLASRINGIDDWRA